MLQESKHGGSFVGQNLEILGRDARKSVLALFNRHSESGLVMHHYAFTVGFVECLEDIARAEGTDEVQLDIARIAGWFFHSGMLFDYQAPAPHSLRLAGEFLSGQSAGPTLTKEIIDCLTLGLNREDTTLASALWLRDADTVSTYLIKSEEKRPLLHLEWELMLRRRLSAAEWNQYWLQQLFKVKLYTHSAHLQYEDELALQIRKLKKQVEKKGEAFALTDTEKPAKSRLYHTLEKNQPARGVQTFFRANYRNHINLSAIADNKANIMISVNSILISVLISILTYKNVSENNPVILLPVVIFLVTGLASLIFAVLSARPKVTKHDQERDPEVVKKNIVFFGNFVHLDLREYEEAMDSVFHDNELLYGNMTRDLYFLGKVLDKKYRYLSISYNIFMLGFIATVSSFLIALLS